MLMRSGGGSAHPTRIRVTKAANLPPPAVPGKRSSCINETNSVGMFQPSELVISWVI